MTFPRRPTLLVPLGCYLAVTVGVPLLNGASEEPGFVEHVLWVVGACGVIAVLGLLRVLSASERI